MQELSTITTVEASSSLGKDIFFINGKNLEEREARRMKAILDKVRELSDQDIRVKAVSENRINDKIYSYEIGKGLGFSASGGAALAAASVKAFGLNEISNDLEKLSTVARRLAGSASRSTVGGFARWYTSEKDEESFARQLASRKDFPDFRMIAYPIQTNIRTEQAHSEVETSPLFVSRLNSIGPMLEQMENAIKARDVGKICSLTEKDSLLLHAVTMTGDSHMLVLEPESIQIFKKIKELRNTGITANVSWDTGPSTFVNTTEDNVNED